MKTPLLLLATLLAPLSFSNAAEKPRLNLVVIQTDEHSFRTLGCYRALLPEDQAFVWGPGVKVDTPHLDWIAQHGAIATRFYATSPVCTPSRASMMTGRYPQNTGAIGNDLPMRDDMVTYAAILRDHGYATGYAGKWHLDGPGKPGWKPQRQFGFDDNRYMFNRGHWKKIIEAANGPRVGATDAQGEPNYNLAGADEKTFTTDFLADRTVEFIRQHRGRPFAYHVSIPDPHGPNTVRAPYDTMFDHLVFKKPQSALSPGDDLPAYAATLPGGANQRQMALYFGMVKCVDDNVGKIIHALREAGVLDHTVIVFTSDHGDLCGEHGRDNKGVPMETSARIPFLVHAPGLIKPGTVVPQSLGTVDFKPTILALLGLAGSRSDEGRDASALFTGTPAAKDWHDINFIRIGLGKQSGWFGAFTTRHKLVMAPGAPASFFDLERDPHEMRNLINGPEYRETIRRLAQELKAYATTRHDPLLESTAIQADLAWAMGSTSTYAPAKRDGSAREMGEDDEAGKGAGKAKGKGKGKAKK
ncbi:MAG: sulfatase [Opitutaceae bacterium]|nr:sulfatase [Opitutaceae bacterium]